MTVEGLTKMSTKRKLNFELIPDACWGVNIHALFSKKVWDYVRHNALERAGNTCEICGKKTSKLDCHEIWSYDEKKGIQKLENVVCVCRDCHNTMHIGRTQLLGNSEKAEDHYMKVNNVSYVEMKQDLKKANEEHKRRNLVSVWKLDLTYLKKIIDYNEKANKNDN